MPSVRIACLRYLDRISALRRNRPDSRGRHICSFGLKSDQRTVPRPRRGRAEVGKLSGCSARSWNYPDAATLLRTKSDQLAVGRPSRVEIPLAVRSKLDFARAGRQRLDVNLNSTVMIRTVGDGISIRRQGRDFQACPGRYLRCSQHLKRLSTLRGRTASIQYLVEREDVEDCSYQERGRNNNSCCLVAFDFRAQRLVDC